MRVELSYEGKIVSVLLPKGVYLFSLWGAQGGALTNTIPGKGAFSNCTYEISHSKRIYAYVGRQGACSNSPLKTDKFQGGNNAIASARTIGCTGGGASFVLLSNSTDDVLLVAGAGGGSGDLKPGGFGGPKASYYDANKYGFGATLSGPGLGGYYPGSNKYPPCRAETGSRFKGGNACASAEGSAGGGGSGYYGGGGGADNMGGGGGSSFARKNVLSVLMNGDELFKSPKGTDERGHLGDGYIRIEKIADIADTAHFVNNLSYFLFVFIDLAECSL